MSEREFENYLTLLSSLLRLSAAQREAVSSELRDHLEERVADLVQQGVAHGDAKQQAIAEFGDAARLAGELSRISQLKKRRWIMRMTTGSLAIAAALVFALMAFWPDAEDGPAPALAQNVERQTEPQQPDQQAETVELSPDDRTAAILRGTSDVQFDELPLQDFLLDLGDRLGINVLIDKRALDFTGVSTDTPVTLSLRGVPTDFALEWMLRQYELGYTIREGVVIVTTPEELKKALDVRVYDVRDLLATVSATKTPVIKTPVEKPTGFDSNNRVPAKLAQFGGGRGGRRGGGGFGGFVPSPSTADGELINLITATVRMGTWMGGGGAGSIRYYHGALVVSQTQDVHREIRQVLAELSRVATLKHEPTVPVNNDKGQGRGGF